MVAEKHAAFGESWNAMAAHAALAQRELTASFYKSFIALARGKKPSPARSAAQLHRAALGVLGKGLAPCIARRSPTPSVSAEPSFASR